jgi:glucose-1-phosphate adenylyltransferase
MNSILTLILGGGAGTRLFPLTKYRAKPAVPLAGKYRLIDVAISNCINSDLKKIYVLTQYLSASLNRHVSQTYVFDMFNQGFVQILAAEQRAEDTSWFQGTADAVRKHWQTLDNFDCDLIMILPGDALYRMDYRDMVRAHIENKADISVAVNTVEQRQAHDFGLLQIDANSRIVAFKEKPKTAAEQAGFEAPPAMLQRLGITEPHTNYFLASMGVYLFNRSVLNKWMTETDHVDFGKQIIPEAIEKHKVLASIHNGYWEDIGTIAAFYKAHMELLRPDPPFRFADPRFPIYTRARFLPNTKIQGANLDRTAVADGCEIGRAIIHKSVVGLRTMIGDFSTIEDSIIMGADYYAIHHAPGNPAGSDIPIGIGKYCHIKRAILDKNVRIGNNVKILNENNLETFDGDNYYIREGIVIIPKNAVIPPGTVI